MLWQREQILRSHSFLLSSVHPSSDVYRWIRLDAEEFWREKRKQLPNLKLEQSLSSNSSSILLSVSGRFLKKVFRARSVTLAFKKRDGWAKTRTGRVKAWTSWEKAKECAVGARTDRVKAIDFFLKEQNWSWIGWKIWTWRRSSVIEAASSGQVTKT